MREKIFQDEWRDSWRHYCPGCHIIKIPDMPRSSNARFDPVKPYDFYAMQDGWFYAMELKLKTQLEAFSFKSVREGQVNNLVEAADNGAQAIIAINYRIQSISDKQRKNNSPLLPKGRLNTVFIFSIQEFTDLDKALYTKSIPVYMLLGAGVSRVHKSVSGYWDIRPLLVGRVNGKRK